MAEAIQTDFISDDSHPLWLEVWEIYSDSFPIYEQRQLKHQLEKFADPCFYCQVFSQQNKVIGFIFWWDIGSQVYIEHLAISSKLRGQNYGSLLLSEFCKAEARPVILEIDPPIDDISQRRLRFYQALGFHLHDFEHIHPPYQEGYQGHRLNVLAYPHPISLVNYQLFNDFLLRRVMDHS